MKSTIKILTLILSIFLLNTQITLAQCHNDDWTALKALYESTNGDNWLIRTGWDVMIANQNSPPVNCNLENLYGVILDEEGRVNCLDFDGNVNCNHTYFTDGNALAGNIPAELSNLTNLEYLILGSNLLNGNIPKELGSLNQLITLSLSANQLNGSIPVELGNLENLGGLRLNNNQLVGDIPSELCDIVNLNYLSLSMNELNGSIPLEIGNLGNLRVLYLQGNDLVGNIPASIGNLINLEVLHLEGNELNGNIPQEIGNLSSIEYLHIHANELSGNLPLELGNLDNLQVLGLGQNQLDGNIPATLGNLSNLRDLRFDYNSLSGTIPQELSNLNLDALRIGNNNLNGCFPSGITPFCNQFNNSDISNGNNFNASWEDFCATGAGICDCEEDCETDVYPGDLNHDGIVNNQDVSLSGLFLYQTGLARDSEHQNINWYPHPSEDWGILNNQNKDIKHHDCNGDGVIDEDDQQAVETNMGQMWSEPDTIVPPDESDYQVMLHPIDQIYDGYLVMNVALERRTGGNLAIQGGHFTVDYSDVEGDFSTAALNLDPTSWLGIPNLNLWYESTPFPFEKKIEVGFTKTNNTNSEGSGVIGQLILEYDNGTAKRANTDYNFEVNTIGVHQNNGEFIPIEDQQLEIIINPNICYSNLTINEKSPFQNVYKSSNNITTNGLVLIGKDQEVEYNANRVRINSGFSVKAGADFKVRSSGCN